MMKWIFGLIALIATVGSVEASCLRIEGLQGYSSKKADGYEFTEDRISKPVLLNSSGGMVRVVGSALTCETTTSTALLCTHYEDGKSVVETWIFDREARIALLTKTTSGYGAHDGSTAMTGQILPCE
jgi:hypothetical protein